MPQSPWQVLELDPVSATVKDVKKSYARRLKLCRPDHDPAGFRDLHSAYTSALRELELPDVKELSPLEKPQPTDAKTDRIDIPLDSSHTDLRLPTASHTENSQGRISMMKVFDRLSLSLRTPNDELAPKLRDAEATLYLHPSEVLYWGQHVNRLIKENASRKDLQFKSEAFFFELENDGNMATLAQIERLDRQADYESIRGFYYLFGSNEKRIANFSGAQAAYRLACAAALWEPSFVKPLADFAYKYLPPAERDFCMAHLDSTVLRTSFYAHIPHFCKWFWVDRLQNPQQSYSWDDSESQNAIRILKSRDARFWPCFLELVRLLPQTQADEIMASHKLPTLSSDPNPELTLYKKNNLHLSGPAWGGFLPKCIANNFIFLWLLGIIAKPFELVARAINLFRWRYLWILFFVFKAIILTPHCASR